MRLKIVPRDVKGEHAARRLSLSLAQFEQALPDLLARGFPAPDPTTGHFDLVAIDRWCDARHVHLFGEGSVMTARDGTSIAQERIAAMRERKRPPPAAA
jgi:hypothetical protein